MFRKSREFLYQLSKHKRRKETKFEIYTTVKMLVAVFWMLQRDVPSLVNCYPREELIIFFEIDEANGFSET